MVSYIGILCFASTTVNCIYVNSLALTGPDALGAPELPLLSLVAMDDSRRLLIS